MTKARNNGARTAAGQFGPGNPGRPKGARHRITRLVEELMEGDAEKLSRAAIELALSGDTVALKLCLDRIAPVRKGRPVVFTAPKIEAASDVTAALGSLLQAVAAGELTPDEGTQIAALLDSQRRAIEVTEIEARLAALETS